VLYHAGQPLVIVEAKRLKVEPQNVRAGKTFTPKQERWLELIRNQLVENLAIEQADFDLIAFTRVGATWGRVDRDFEGTLIEV